MDSPLAGCPSYRFGSGDSLDRDVLYAVDALPDFATAKRWCASREENRNLIVVRDGVVSDSFKGSPDETNNALLATYHLHPQDHPLPVTRPRPRVVPLKAARAIRVALSMMSRTSQRPLIKPALSSLDQAQRVAALAAVDFHAITLPVDAWKSVAFQLGQLLALIEGQELYTKAGVARYAPGLSAFLARRPERDIGALSALRDRLIAAMSVVYTRTAGSLNLFCYRSATMKAWNRYAMQSRGAVIDLRGERLLVHPYDKFFQLDEIDGWRQADFAGQEADEIVEKVDGSLVSLFSHDGALRFVTKGSFDAPQAAAAHRLAGACQLERLDLERWDHVFEVVTHGGRFPGGFTSVRYAEEGLYLIGMRDRQTGALADYQRITETAARAGCRAPRRYAGTFAQAVAACAAPEWRNAEGWIARFGDKRVKLKHRAHEQTSRVINALHRDPDRLCRKYLRMPPAQREGYGRFLPPDLQPHLQAALAPCAAGCAALLAAADAVVGAHFRGDVRALLAVLEQTVAPAYRGLVIRRARGQPTDEAAHRALAWTARHAPERLGGAWATVDIRLSGPEPAAR